MSILVHGMRMPKDCPMCPMAHYDATDNFRGCEIVGGKKHAMQDPEYANSSARPDWCPLVEVPPHGDLIDRDALPSGRVEWEDVVGAAVVIPADKSQ